MPKIRVDVSNVEERSFEPPKPGIYPVKVKEVEVGKSKAQNDQVRIQLQITKNPKGFEGAVLSHYIPLDVDSPGYFRMLELATALGQKRKKFVLDTDTLVGKGLRMRVKSDTYEGEYSPKVGAILPPGETEPEEDDEDLNEDDDEKEAKPAARRSRKSKAKEPEPDEDEDDLDEDADDDNDADEDDADSDADADEDGDDYDEWSIEELKAELEERSLRTAGKKTVLIGRLRKDDESEDDPFDGE